MELTLVGSKPLTEAAFLVGSGSDTLVIDATKLTLACPLDLAGMVAMAQSASMDSIRVVLRLPSDPAVASYLQRMDVLRHMPSRTQILGRLPPDTRTDQRERLMEVTALNAQNVDDLSEKLGPLVTSFYKSYPGDAGAAVFRACSELMGNATEHGVSERGAFIAAQLYTGSSSGDPRLEFAVCDTGIGVMQHLRQNPAYAYLTRDEVAIAKAMDAGVSGSRVDLRGNGLSDAIEHTRHDGRVALQVRSGRGEVRVEASVSGRRETPSCHQDQTSGTWAWLTHHLLPQTPNYGSIGKMKPEKP